MEEIVSRMLHFGWEAIKDSVPKNQKWWCNITEPAEDRNFLITKLEEGKLRINHDALRKVFIRPELENKQIAIISIAGDMRTGKSFLMNFVLRYLRRKGWENPNWMGDGNFAVEDNGLPYIGGTERCTTGIRIFGEVFEVPVSEKETMMVMLMDSQELFDHNSSDVVNKTLLTLTTLISSVQIFNSKNNVDTRTMEYLKICVDYALQTTASTKEGESAPKDYMKLQNLMFLIRDFPEVEEQIYGLEIGNRYLQKVLDSREGGEDLIQVRSRIKKSFDRVECFALPHPGIKATRLSFQGKNKNLEMDFLENVKPFVEYIVSPDNLVAKRSGRKYVSAREMLNMVTACDDGFAKKMIDAGKLIKMSEKVFYSSLCEQAIKVYDKLMEEKIFMNDDLKQLEQKHQESINLSIKELNDAQFVGALDDAAYKEKYLKRFKHTCANHFNNTMQQYHCNMRSKEIKTAEAVLEYESKMQEILSEEKWDGANFEEHHKDIYNNSKLKYQSSINLNAFESGVIKEYEKLKNKIKEQREYEEKFAKMEVEQQCLQDEIIKRRLQDDIGRRCARTWNEFLTSCPDDNAIKKKREELELQFSNEFKEFAGPDDAVLEEILADLDSKYLHAKQCNDQQLSLERKKVDNAVDEMTLNVIREYNEMMVDRHIKEDAIRENFQKLLTEADANQYVKDMPHRVQKYFQEQLKSKCDKVMVDIRYRTKKISFQSTFRSLPSFHYWTA